LIPYRFRRRAFLTALSGGVGLKIMLRNLEGAAAGMRSPARLLVTHWPLGIVAGSNNSLWTPTTGSVGGSLGLKPFADAGLGPDMTVIRGVTQLPHNLAGAGGAEQGLVIAMTGRAPVGTRVNCCEGDDAIAAPGGSIEQILLGSVPALQRPGKGYANSIADSRTDLGEISTQCLSYSTEAVDVERYAGTGLVSGAKPLMPELAPLMQFTNIFSSLIPGAQRPVADAMLKKMVGKRSVLDFAAEELNQVKRMAPSAARSKLGIHTDAVRAAETSVAAAINARYPNPDGGVGGNGGPACGATCMVRPLPPLPTMGKADPAGGRGSGNAFGTGRDVAMEDDAPVHAQMGKAHLDVLKAAFICDLIRVGTYQWSTASNHVGFALYPDTTQPYQHHPVSHRIGTNNTVAAATPEALIPAARFLFNVQLWYFARHAENFATWKTALDGCGNSLLDFTCVPFLTEVRANGHERTDMPAMIIGGKQLGFVHDRYVTGSFSINQFWGTIAHAFGHTSTDAPFAAPIDGFLTRP
jgi:hypothetical protein